MYASLIVIHTVAALDNILPAVFTKGSKYFLFPLKHPPTHTPPPWINARIPGMLYWCSQTVHVE